LRDIINLSFDNLSVSRQVTVKRKNNNKKEEKIFCEIMSSVKLEDLPNEIITKVLSYLEIRDLIFFGHLSKRTRAVRRNKPLWRKLTFHGHSLKSEFLKFIVTNGCKFLKLILVWLKGSLRLRKASRLQELSLDNCEIENQALKELLGSCHSLKN
jgi:hypothetical protein